MGDLWIELNIAVLPDGDLAGKLVQVSGDFAANYHAIVRLGDAGPRLTMAPHLTLYQVPVPLAGLTQLHTGLSDIARAGQARKLECERLVYNAGEASLEAQTGTPEDLAALQRAVIALAGPMRSGRMLERDPAGNRVEALAGETGPAARNIRDTGYAEVGELFRPHYTLNWFVRGTSVPAEEIGSCVDPTVLSGYYTAVGMFALGPYGTCPQLLARYELGG